MDASPIDAVFENGSFRPLEPVPIPIREGEHVRLRVEEAAEPTSLELACQVYDGLSPAEIEEVERVALRRGNFFSSSTAG